MPCENTETYDNIVKLNSHLLPNDDFVLNSNFCQDEDAVNCVAPLKHHKHEYWVCFKRISLELN